MKKIALLLTVVLLALPFSALTGCANRAGQLKMYVPGEYIDEEMFDDFEAWYLEQTGEKVEVVTPTTFDTVEEIMTAIEHDHADYDLVLPSDYAVEQLINKNLVVEYDSSLIDLESLIRPEYVERARISDPQLKYSVPYMYGTFGIMYDFSKTGKHIDSWDAIFGTEYAGKSANKGSLREALSSAAIWADREELGRLSSGFTDYNDAYVARLTSLYEDFSDAAIDKAIGALETMKSHSSQWGGEDLKFNMAAGTSNVEVALMWSCDAGYIMNEYEDDDGNVHPGNRNMWYVVPKEGGNIYLDCFVISKYAKNTKAANYFLKWLCTKEVAIGNSEYAGAVSPVKEAYDELYAEYTSEEFDDEEWGKMYIDMLFPSQNTLRRCGTMRDYGPRDGAISTRWANVYTA